MEKANEKYADAIATLRQAILEGIIDTNVCGSMDEDTLIDSIMKSLLKPDIQWIHTVLAKKE